MKFRVLWALAFALLMAWAVNAEPVQLYVSTLGDDAASGAEDAPLASLAGARDRLRALRSAQGVPDGAMVTFGGGVYPVQKAVGFTPEDAGTADHGVKTHWSQQGHGPSLCIGRG